MHSHCTQQITNACGGQMGFCASHGQFSGFEFSLVFKPCPHLPGPEEDEAFPKLRGR